ncbi:hypothetical protein SLA2020_013320 [Shorea laevis]
MEPRTFSRLVLLFLGFSYLLHLHSCPCAAVPISRSFLKPNMKDSSSVQSLYAQDAVDVTEELLREGEGNFEGRLLESLVDYPGTGANNHHDPKTPGRP